MWMDIMTWPMWTLATVPWGFVKATHIPVWSLWAPAQDNILLMQMTWKGWSLTPCESYFCHNFSLCTCWHKYWHPPELQKRAGHIHLVSYGHRVGTHPLLPSVQVKDENLGIRDTSTNVRLHKACSYNTGNIVQSGVTGIFTGLPKGKELICFYICHIFCKMVGSSREIQLNHKCKPINNLNFFSTCTEKVKNSEINFNGILFNLRYPNIIFNMYSM